MKTLNTIPQIVRAVQELYVEVEKIKVKLENAPAVTVSVPTEPTRGRRRKIEEDVVVSPEPSDQ